MFNAIALSSVEATDIIYAPPAALVNGVQGTFRVAALITLVGAGLLLALWKMERIPKK